MSATRAAHDRNHTRGSDMAGTTTHEFPTTKEGLAATASATKSKRQSPGLKARAEAVNRLIEAHEDEYHGYLTVAFAGLGIDYTRPETPEERAERKRLALIEAKRKALEELGREIAVLEAPAPVEEPEVPAPTA